MKQLIEKLIRILSGEEGPSLTLNYSEDAHYVYPERIALARKVAIEMENLLTNQSSRQQNRCACGNELPDMCDRCSQLASSV